jgi:putative aldouronate transport system substrate-binding protein
MLTASDGHIYYVPGTNVTNNYQPCLMWNMKWFSDLGYAKAPMTISGLVDVLRKYRDRDMNGNGKKDEVPMSITSKFLPYAFGPAFGLNLIVDDGFHVNDSGKVCYGFYEQDYKKYLQFLNGLYKEGLLGVEFTTLNRDQIIERISTDRTGLTFDFS